MQDKLRTSFLAKYGALIQAGAIAPCMVDDLVRGVAFTLLTAKDETSDLRRTIAELEGTATTSGAIDDLVLWMNHQITRAVGR